MFFKIFLYNSFFEIFKEFPNEIKTGIQTRFIQNNGNFYFLNCIFNNLNSIYGSSILINSNNEIKLLIEYNLFSFCSTTGGDGGNMIFSGGAIYFYGINSQLYLNKVCGYKCKTYGETIYNYHGQFSYSQTKNNGFHNFNYVSILECSPKTTKLSESSSILMYCGNQLLSNLNSSNNFCFISSSFMIINNNLSIIKFINSINNSVRNWINFGFSGNSKGEFYSSNIIGNNNPSQLHGLIYLIDNFNLTLKSLIFINNKGLLSSIYNTAYLNLLNCLINHLDNFGIINSALTTFFY